MQAPLLLQDCMSGAVYPCHPGARFVIGRDDPAAPPHVPCRDPAVSRPHCEVYVRPDLLGIVDRSSYGTFINGARVEGTGAARVGDTISLGASQYRFTVLPGPGAAPAPWQPSGETTAPPPPMPTTGEWADPPGGHDDTAAHSSPVPDGPQEPGGLPPVLDDRFRLEGELARGGMGVVYAGRDQQTGEQVAVKVLRGGARTRAQDVERFRREAELGQRLGQHPGVVAVRASGSLPSGVLYYVMDFVEGRSLDAVSREVSREQAVRLVLEVSRTVAFAHEQGVIHRDLKPNNVIVTPEGRVRLTDFGIAKALDAVQGLTATGAVMGTPTYMPPEQVRDSKRVDPRSDVYGLGGILYYALAGRPPLDVAGLNLRQALKRVLANEIVPPAKLDPTIDASLDAICRRALAGDPNLRQPTAAALADELEAWLGGDRTVIPAAGPSTEKLAEPDLPPDGDADEAVPGLGLALSLLVGLILLAAVVVALKHLG